MFPHSNLPTPQPARTKLNEFTVATYPVPNEDSVVVFMVQGEPVHYLEIDDALGLVGRIQDAIDKCRRRT